MAYEGFFTITTNRRGTREPLPELQPFYSVLTWHNFERSKHVRKSLSKLRNAGRSYTLTNSLNPQRTWRLLDAYHKRKYGSNWLTRDYFDMLQAASADPSINFRLQCVELYEAPSADTQEQRGSPAPTTHISKLFAALRGAPRAEPLASNDDLPVPLAGEIGFSIGCVYTSLSGWTEQRTADALGTSQLVLLCKWLQRKGFAFWSLGHCYSPEMDYKRQLGHRVLPRWDFIGLLKKHRGDFELGADAREHDVALKDGETIVVNALLEA